MSFAKKYAFLSGIWPLNTKFDTKFKLHLYVYDKNIWRSALFLGSMMTFFVQSRPKYLPFTKSDFCLSHSQVILQNNFRLSGHKFLSSSLIIECLSITCPTRTSWFESLSWRTFVTSGNFFAPGLRWSRRKRLWEDERALHTNIPKNKQTKVQLREPNLLFVNNSKLICTLLMC